MCKSVIIGLDGATFDMLDPFIEEGILPHLKNIIKEGSRCILKSTIPFYTGPAWVSMVTGVNPGKHGIFNFTKYSTDSDSRRVLNSRDIRCLRIWELLNRRGLKTGMVNIPMTYPADAVDGFMIAGMMSPEKNEKVSYPSQLMDKIDDVVNDYVIDVPVILEKHKDDPVIIERLHDCLLKRGKAAEFLMKNYEVDFLMYVFITPDRLQHLFWKYLDRRISFMSSEDTLCRDRILDCYRLLDEIVGGIVQASSEETNLFIVSDHGFGEYKKCFHLNNWLMELGLLRLRKGASLLTSFVEVANISGIKKLLPRRFIKRAKEAFSNIIDHEATRAYAADSLEQGIYLNLDNGSADTYHDVCNCIINELYKLRDPETGEKIVTEVKTRGELFSGPFVAEAPDVLINMADMGYQISNSIIHSGCIVSRENEPFGIHKRDGIFIAHGTGIKKDNLVDQGDIVDIVPTVLHSMGLPIPAYLDGKVLDTIFTESFNNDHAVKYEEMSEYYIAKSKGDTYTDEEALLIQEKLRGLGYIE